MRLLDFGERRGTIQRKEGLREMSLGYVLELQLGGGEGCEGGRQGIRMAKVTLCETMGTSCVASST